MVSTFLGVLPIRKGGPYASKPHSFAMIHRDHLDPAGEMRVRGLSSFLTQGPIRHGEDFVDSQE
jgi:hypothetical protein